MPDFLSGKGPNGGGTDTLGQDVGKTIQSLTPADVNAPPERCHGVRQEAARLERQDRRRRLLLGRRRSFGYAAAQPALNAAVVYYGDAPGSADNTLETALANVKAPVLGLYAGNDARIGATVPERRRR